MIKLIDHILNRITMYRLVLYYLIALVFVAFVLGNFGLLHENPANLLFSTGVILAVCLVTNWMFARAFNAVANVESVYITALILVLIITPVGLTDFSGIGFLIFASVWAMASKFIFAIGKKHIFNPAAFAVALTALTINHSATWWVGTLYMLPFVLVGGLLVVRKIQRFDLVASFAVVVLVGVLFVSAGNYVTLLTQIFLDSPFFFLAFVMLTEPLSTPPNRYLRIVYGALVGFLFLPNIHVGNFYLTPELALLIGNIFSYLVSPKGRYVLTLKTIEQVTNDVFDFVFTPDRPFSFTPGQYAEWTLGHRSPDTRGNRRYFTIASSPAEQDVRLGVKFYTPPSSFKKALSAMKIGSTISVSQIAGSFVLPKDTNKKLVFIAGGIGVTPFRSMIQHLLETKERRPIVLFYGSRSVDDIAYKDILDRAERELGIKTIYATGGVIDAKLIAQEVPDYLERTFYISGPQVMIESFKKTLKESGVSRFKIKSDFFPGFA